MGVRSARALKPESPRGRRPRARHPRSIPATSLSVWLRRVSNASFAAGTIPHEALADELTRWAAWQWARTLLQIAAFAAALLGLRERLEH